MPLVDSANTEESQSLLYQDFKIDEEIKKRDSYVVSSVNRLHEIVQVFTWSSILSTVLAVVNISTSMSIIPVWSIFFVLWMGHVAAFLISIHIFFEIFKALTYVKSEYHEDSLLWHQANENRIPLVQYVLYHLFQILGLSFCIFMLEFLLYLSLENNSPTYLYIIPVYFVSFFGFVYSITCRANQLSAGLSWTCLLWFCIMYNVKLLHSSWISWGVVLLPLCVLIIIWFYVLCHILFQHWIGSYVLKSQQWWSMCLYFLGMICLFIVLYYLRLYLDCDSNSQCDSDSEKSLYLTIIGIIGVIGESSVFLGLSLCVRLALTIAVNRNGGERPKPLTCTSEGGWDIDRNQTFEYFVFFGEIEVVAPTAQYDYCCKDYSYQLNQSPFRDPL